MRTLAKQARGTEFRSYIRSQAWLLACLEPQYWKGQSQEDYWDLLAARLSQENKAGVIEQNTQCPLGLAHTSTSIHTLHTLTCKRILIHTHTYIHRPNLLEKYININKTLTVKDKSKCCSNYLLFHN